MVQVREVKRVEKVAALKKAYKLKVKKEEQKKRMQSKRDAEVFVEMEVGRERTEKIADMTLGQSKGKQETPGKKADGVERGRQGSISKAKPKKDRYGCFLEPLFRWIAD